MREEPLYWENQRIEWSDARVLACITLLLMFVVTSGAPVSLAQEGFPAAGWVLEGGIAAIYAAIVLSWVGCVTTDVRRPRIVVRLGLRPLPVVVRIDSVRCARCIRYDPDLVRRPTGTILSSVRVSWGFGAPSGEDLIGLPSTRAYTARGDRGVLLELAGGRWLLVGSEHPERMVDALSRIGVPAGSPRGVPRLATPAGAAVGAPRSGAPSAAPIRALRPSGTARYREVLGRRSVLGWIALAAIVVAASVAAAYSGEVMAEPGAWRLWWPTWVFVPIGILVGLCAVLCPAAMVVVDRRGMLVWRDLSWRLWPTDRLAQCAPFDEADVLAGVVVLPGPLIDPQMSRSVRPIETGGGVAVLLTDGSHMLVPSRDPHALCRALGSIGVEVVTAEELRRNRDGGLS